MARFFYKGHDIYTRSVKTSSGTDYIVSIDGQKIGEVSSIGFKVDEQYRANQREPISLKTIFSNYHDTVKMRDGAELSMTQKVAFMKDGIHAFINGQELYQEALHDRSLGDLRKVAQNYDQLGRLTDEQFLALKSLTEPVILHTGHIKTQAGKFMPTAYIDELQTQKALSGHGALRSNSISHVRPGEHVFFDLRADGPFSKLPSELFLNGNKSYVNRVEVTVKESYMSRYKDETAEINRKGTFTRPFTVEGQISVYGKDGSHTVNGVFTNVDYRDEASKFRNEMYMMTPEQRAARMEAIRNVVEGVTLAEYATIRDLHDRGIAINEELLVSIASKDGQWQIDRDTVKNMEFEQDSPVMSIDELEQGFDPTAPVIDGDGNEWVQMSFDDIQQDPGDLNTGSGNEIEEPDFEGPEIGE